jgi:hypothetical protein
MITNNLGCDDQFEYFGEWVPYERDYEKVEAETYLNLWKKIMIRKIANQQISQLEFIEDMLIDRPPYLFGYHSLSDSCCEPSAYGTLAMKLKFKGRLPRENPQT